METLGATVVFWALVVLAGVFVVVSALLPTVWVKRQFTIPEDEKRAGVEDSYRKTIAQILGAAAIAVTWYWTWSKDRINSANQQYSELLKYVASKNVDERVAGLYPLEKLVLTDSDCNTPVMSTLRSIIKKSELRPPDGAEKPKVSEDVLAAIYVMGRLPAQPNGPMNPINMEHLVGGNFSGLTGFRRAKFSAAALFAANFSYADLTGAVFDGAQMSDWESFGATRWSIDVYNEWMKSKQWERVDYVVTFNHATLTGASFRNMSVDGAIFDGADLTGTTFDNTDLSRADFRNALNLDKAVFSNNCFDEGEPLGLPQKIFPVRRC
jgi:Na+-transporting methylmalonyl-CoA/oxaloacetate decarboxylase gamma subunit